MRKLLSRTAAIALIAVVGAALTAAPASASADKPAPDPSTAKFEVDFLIGMIDHHAMAVEMAEICLEKAVNEDLVAMCEGIIASQSAQIEQMQFWLADWYGVTYAPEMKPGDMKMLEKLASIEDPAEFEIEFMESMIKHHRKAIREGEMCLRKAYHDELIDLCENIIKTQSAEIAQMEAWLCEWYERCTGRPAAA